MSLNWQIIQNVIAEQENKVRDEILEQIQSEDDFGSGLISKERVIAIVNGTM